MQELSPKQKKFLKGEAHKLQPIVHVGKEGITEGVTKETERALLDHELIKVKMAGLEKEDFEAFVVALGEASSSHLVGSIGRIAIFYKPSSKEGKKKIKLP